MKIDFDHWKGAQLGDDMSSMIDTKRMLDVIESLKPEFSQDGNQYCYLYGTLPNDCVIGFGSTAFEAMKDFYNNFYTQKAVNTTKL